MTAPEGPAVNQPAAPEVIVAITRYEVCVLPADDINWRDFALYVEQTRRGTWIVNNGAGGYDIHGRWTDGVFTAHEFAALDDALDLARRLAPGVTVNGHTATDAYRRTHPA
jgi:hypothetical protein